MGPRLSGEGPFTPLAHLFGFTPLPAAFLAILTVMVMIYLALVERGKYFFFGRLPIRPQLPVARWELAPALQRVERLASRWTVGPKPPTKGRGARPRRTT